MARTPVPPSEPWSAGDGVAVRALLAQPFPKHSTAHPIWDLLKHVPRFGSPEEGVALLNLIWEKGFDPGLVEGPHGNWGKMRKQARARLCAPDRSGESVHATAPLLSRAMLLPPAHRDAWLTRLDELGVRPKPRDWRTALREGQVNWIRRWRAAGYPMPPVQDLARMAIQRLVLPSDKTYVRTMELLVELGWTPQPEDLELAHSKSSHRATYWLLGKDAALARGLDDQSRLDMWTRFWSHWDSRATPDMVEGILRDPNWRATVLAPLPNQEWWGMPGVFSLCDTPPPAWLAVLHAMPGTTDTATHYPFQIRAESWERTRTLLDLPKGGWGGWTHGELWAARSVPPEMVLKEFPDAALPNPETGRWPAAAAPLKTREAWVAAGGGLDAALGDPTGPLVEWAARVATRTSGQDDTCAWVATVFEKAPASALTHKWQGCSLESWCSIHPELAKAWTRRTGKPPRPGSPLDSLWPAACAGAVASLAKRLAGLSEAEKTGAAQEADRLGLGWHQLMRWGCDSMDHGGVSLSMTERSRQRNKVEVGLMLAGAGWALPEDPEAWELWKSIWERQIMPGGGLTLLPSTSEGQKPSLMELWPLMKGWPTCLAETWLSATLRMSEMSGHSDEARTQIVQAMVSDTLATARDPGAVAAASVRAIVDPHRKGNGWAACMPTPTEASEAVFGAIWRALPGAAELGALPFGAWLDGWGLRRQTALAQDEGDGHAEFWVRSPLLKSLAQADDLRLKLDSAPKESMPRCRM